MRRPTLCSISLTPPSPSELRRLVRGALCLSVWRATGSTGGWLKGYPCVGAARGSKGSYALPAAALWPRGLVSAAEFTPELRARARALCRLNGTRDRPSRTMSLLLPEGALSEM